MTDEELEQMSDAEILEYLKTLEPSHSKDIYQIIIEVIMEYYQNDIFPELPTYIGAFIDKHWEYKDLFYGGIVTLNDILYFIRDKRDLSKEELFKYIVEYVEIRNGIFKRTQSRTV